MLRVMLLFQTRLLKSAIALRLTFHNRNIFDYSTRPSFFVRITEMLVLVQVLFFSRLPEFAILVGGNLFCFTEGANEIADIAKSRVETNISD